MTASAPRAPAAAPGLAVVEADLADPSHGAATLELLGRYAAGPMGAGRPLSDEARQALVPGLRQHPTTHVFLVWQGPRPVGLAICFLGFSTFAARPLLNLSDYYVVEDCRGRGVGAALLQAVEAAARRLGCCKLTLEVQEHNTRARAVYAHAGFSPAVHVQAAGAALFLTKPL